VQKIHEIIDTVASTESSVVIRGESGTGKELIARRIHAKSSRMYSPLVPVNCGGLSETLLESELFGHEKGAFTGAQYRHRGKLEMANGGTLFLDEIGTISMKTQIELLRVLDTHQFTRLGGSQVLTVDFRLICATNQDLEDLVRRGLFREDFYYRINVFPIVVPPLRDRPADIPMLVQHFVDKFTRQINKKLEGISPRAMETILACPWPGNVRELKNAIERAVVVAAGPMIEPEDLPVSNGKKRMAPVTGTLEAVEKAHIAEMLEQAHWNITRAAQTLGIDRVTLYNKIKKYGLSRSLPSHS
jgi:transcriptional regulator with PAS, ATPase and Fis domain